jgi:hypothetical protein
MNLFTRRDDPCPAESGGRKRIAQCASRLSNTTPSLPESGGRKRIAQCASTGKYAQDGLAPERGVRIRERAHLVGQDGILRAGWQPGPSLQVSPLYL